MPSIVPPDTDLQAEDALRALEELAPPCEYDMHERIRSRDAAAWVVVYELRVMCDCGIHPDVKLFCDPCWCWRNHLGATQCHACGRIWDGMENVLRVERL